MATSITSLIGDLRLDLADPDSVQFTDNALRRAITRALAILNIELSTSYLIDSDEVVPTLTPIHYELLLLLAGACAAQQKCTQAATAFRFKSGDKDVDKTSQYASWSKLYQDLMARFKETLATLIPAKVFTAMPNVLPTIYESGTIVAEPEDKGLDGTLPELPEFD